MRVSTTGANAGALGGFAALLLTAWAAPSLAQSRPPLAPTRDVTVDYVTDTKAQPQGGVPAVRPGSKITMTFKGGTTKMRVQTADMPGYMIMDRAAGRALMVMTPQRMYMEMSGGQAKSALMAADEKAQFVRKGPDTVAGLRCTIWETTYEDQHGTLCITDDGVLLRGESQLNGNPSTLTATAVRYGAVPDSQFQPPADFKKMDLNAMQAGRPGQPAK